MALTLGKLSLIVGAGLVGSVLAKEGRLSNVPDLFTGTFKIVLKQLRQDDSSTSSSKPKNNSLMQQVNSLREELQLLASNRSVTIVHGNQSGSGKYGIAIIVVVVGGGCIWWKGWKISDMMFATRRGLNDACNAVAQQLENVYSSVSTTKSHLSSRIDSVDVKIDECADNTAATRDEVYELRGDLKLMGADVHSVHQAMRSLETKISRIEGRQNETNFGVGKLVNFVRNLEHTRSREQIEGVDSSSSRPSLELSPISPSRAVSLPAKALTEPPSPSSSNGSPRQQATFSSSSQVSGSGLKELNGIFGDTGDSTEGTVGSSKENHVSEESTSDNSAASRFGLKYSGFSSLFTRSRSTLK